MNKQRKEDDIDAALLVLQREFSRANLLREIHSSDSMKTYIADAYRLGIEFAREVTLYYSRSTYRRLLEAVTKPPQLFIDQKLSEITTTITEIEKERATLDSQRLFQVQRRIEEVKVGVDEVRNNVEGENFKSGVQKQADLVIWSQLRINRPSAEISYCFGRKCCQKELARTMRFWHNTNQKLQKRSETSNGFAPSTWIGFHKKSLIASGRARLFRV